MTRVVHVVRSDVFAGVERYVALAATGLAGRGWDVTVVGGALESMRPALGESIRHVPAATTGDAVRALARLGRTDIVHAHMTAAEGAATITKPVTRARLVSTRHIAAPRGSGRSGKLVARIVRGALSVQIAPSEYVAAATGEPCVVIPHGVTPGEVDADRERVVVVLQRLEPEKATDVALRAWAASNLADDGFRMLIAGRGSQLTDLEALAARLGVASSVEFLGFIDDPRGLLRRASVLLAPTPTEAFGFAVCEAMAEGTPVVAADGGSHAELLGEEALLFPPGDSQAAAAVLKSLVLDAGRLRAYGRHLSMRQSEQFSIEKHLDRVESVYRQVLGID